MGRLKHTDLNKMADIIRLDIFICIIVNQNIGISTQMSAITVTSQWAW